MPLDGATEKVVPGVTVALGVPKANVEAIACDGLSVTFTTGLGPFFGPVSLLSPGASGEPMLTGLAGELTGE